MRKSSATGMSAISRWTTTHSFIARHQQVIFGRLSYHRCHLSARPLRAVLRISQSRRRRSRRVRSPASRNPWLVIKWAQQNLSCPTGHILALFADNTSAVSWLHFTAITPNSEYRHLARVASALLVAAANLTIRVQPQHIADLKNGEADCLS
jgi:hypothetical protein